MRYIMRQKFLRETVVAEPHALPRWEEPRP
jgi:hypothetical protein